MRGCSLFYTQYKLMRAYWVDGLKTSALFYLPTISVVIADIVIKLDM